MNDDDAQRDDLAERVAMLELLVSDLASGLTRQVVTRKVRVVDDDGITRVVISAESSAGSVLVRLDRPDGSTTGAELFAADEPDTSGRVGLAILRDGDVITSLQDG